MQYLGETAALGAAVLWSFSSFVFTGISLKISTWLLNIARLILAALLLIVTIFAFGINYDVSLRQFIFLSLSGFTGLVIGDTFLFKSFKEIGPRVSMLLMSTNPALGAIMAYFTFGELMSFWGAAGIAITLSGVFLVVMEQRGQSRARFKITKAGVFYGVMSAIGQAVGLIFSKYAYIEGDVHSLTATLVRIGVSAVIMIPMTMMIPRLKSPVKPLFTDRKLAGMVLIGSIIGPYLGITFSFIAVINTKVGVASTLMSTVPILMLPISGFLYKEKLSWQAIAGAFIAVAGVAVLFMY